MSNRVPLPEAVNHMKALIARSEQPSVAVVDELFNYALSAGWAYFEKQVLHKHVAWHDSNRFGVGIDPADVHSLTDQIVETARGWSKATCGVGRAFETAPPNTARHTEQLAKIDSVINAAAGFIPKLNHYDIHILSVSNSHTEGVVSTIYHKTKGHNPKYCTHGVIDQEKMFNLCPSIKEPVEKRVALGRDAARNRSGDAGAPVVHTGSTKP